MTHAATRRGGAAGARPPVQQWWRTVEIAVEAADAVMPSGELCWLAPSIQIAGWSTALRIPLDDPERRVAAADLLTGGFAAIDGAGGPGPLAFASLTFDPHAPGSVLVVPRTTVRRHDGRAWLTVVQDRPVTGDDLAVPPAPGAPAAPPRVRYAGATAAEIAWVDAVDRAVRRIRDGQIEKVVLARDRLVYSDDAFDLPGLVTHLHRRFPSCYTFRVEGLVGASPELLVRRDGSNVTSMVLAGTARRGGGEREDRRIGAQLLASPKDLAEHRPAVDSVRSTLGPLVSRLDVEEHPHLLKLANVQHLATRITGTLTSPIDALELAGRLHPTAAVGGTPTGRALDVIAELETIDRGRYAGPVGWVDAAGDGEFAIALRCAQVDGAMARLFAGAGLVAGSLPESELEETRLKLRAMQSAFGATR